MDMNQMGMMGMPQMMGMDPSANMMGGNMPEMQGMGMNMFTGGYPGMNPNQMPGAPQGQNPNAQGGNINNTSQ